MDIIITEPLDRVAVNTSVTEALSHLDEALKNINSAESEIRNEFTGESFDTYIEVLNSTYGAIMNLKDQLYDLYR